MCLLRLSDRPAKVASHIEHLSLGVSLCADCMCRLRLLLWDSAFPAYFFGHRSHSVTLLADLDLVLEVVGLTGAEIVDERSVDVADEFVGM